MIRIISIFLFSLLFVFNAAAQEDRYPYLEGNESELFLGGILKLDPQPKDIKEQFKTYNDIVTLYVKARETNPPTMDSIKVFIFSVMMADIMNSVHIMEEAGADTVPLMKKNPKLFFQALDGIPFCTESACNALREYFDLYNKPGKDEFILKYEPIIRDSLQFTAEKCLQSLKK
jgi:hypothetical protein